jgi:5-(carboxyamino)imidazole ribonucleotide mutase
MVQMPQGVPVGCMAIGKAGAVNAGVFAAQVLGIKYPEIAAKLLEYKKKLAKSVEDKDFRLQQLGAVKYLEEKK